MNRLTLELPESLIDDAKRAAEQERLPLDEFVARLLTENLRLRQAWEQRVRRGSRVPRERFLEILGKAPDVPPMPGDEIE
jgi:hypothetical protein